MLLEIQELLRSWLVALATVAGARAQRVVAVDVDGIVHPVTVEVISRALEEGASRAPRPC